MAVIFLIDYSGPIKDNPTLQPFGYPCTLKDGISSHAYRSSMMV